MILLTKRPHETTCYVWCNFMLFCNPQAPFNVIFTENSRFPFENGPCVSSTCIERHWMGHGGAHEKITVPPCEVTLHKKFIDISCKMLKHHLFIENFKIFFEKYFQKYFLKIIFHGFWGLGNLLKILFQIWFQIWLKLFKNILKRKW